MIERAKLQVPAIRPAFRAAPVPHRRTAPAVSGWRSESEHGAAERLYERAGALASQNGPRRLDIYL